MTTAAALAPGTQLAGFRIEAEIGRGGMGVVYRATQLSLERQVALKLISSELASEERFRERFLREARLAASIDHPHVLPVYEAGEVRGTLFLAMRLVEGSSLAELLRSEGRLSPERALRLFSQLAQALACAHEAGLLHRDVKPHNVLLTGESEHEHAYLCDFGLARRLSGGSLTAERAFLGTATYAAPEQIRGEPPDVRCDLYSLSCLLYECLTGEPPFVREDELALLWAHLHEPAPAPSSVDPALASFDPFFARALAKDPDERYPSAAELAQAAQAALAGALPAAPSAPGPALKLPRPLSSFLGRERELQEVLELLLHEDVRFLTLTGPGGTGKTRLALRAAEEAVPAYPDGVFWVGLASLRDSTLVSEAIAQAVEAKGELAEHIADKRLLLLLDNLEQVVEAAPELSALLSACPNLTLLVTSRELLRVHGEVEYSVPPLREPEAVSLFCARSQLQPSEEIAELCARLDNLPLAVELAAARTKALTVAQILKRLFGRLDLLKGGRDADPRQQTLRATIDWSYDLLSEDEQRLFCRLFVFAGGCTLEAAEEVCGADLDTLQSLVEKSLLRFTDGRYWMLETIREYARERLEESNEIDEVAGPHAAFFASFLETAFPAVRKADPVWLSRLDHERDNVRAALEWVYARADFDAALRLVIGAQFFWWLRGQIAEASRWHDLVLEHAAKGTPSRGKALVGAARFAWMLHDHERAEARAREALELWRRIGDVDWTIRSLNELGNTLAEKGELEDATRCYHDALGLARAHGDTDWVIVLVENVAETLLDGCRYEEARAYYEQSLQDALERDHTYGKAAALAGLGYAELGVGRNQSASKAFAEALRHVSEIGNRELACHCFRGLAVVAARSSDVARAARLGALAASMEESLGAPLSLGPPGLAAEAADLVRGELGEERYAHVCEEARIMDFEEAVEYALASID